MFQKLIKGDLVCMREWDDAEGWKIREDHIFMILNVQSDVASDSDGYRDVVRFSGCGVEGETLAGYFIKVEAANI